MSKAYKKGKERQCILPPDDQICVIDSWAEKHLADSGICLKDDCDTCTRWKLHAKRAKISREEYRWVVNRNNKSKSVIYFACDMEKVIMLPRLPGMKKAIFTRRIILFHKTFAPLGGTKNSQDKPIGVIWHEGIMMKILQARTSKLSTTSITGTMTTLYFGLIIVPHKIRIGHYI